ncbi:MAG: hypothetical protein AAGJ96_12400, partial [Pseudomonadota bacterium]
MTDTTAAPASTDEDNTPLREYGGMAGWAVAIFCFAISAVHLFLALFPVLSEFDRNVLHFGGFAILAGALYPMTRRGGWKTGRLTTALDISVGVLAALSAVWFILHEERLYGLTQPF